MVECHLMAILQLGMWFLAPPTNEKENYEAFPIPIIYAYKKLSGWAMISMWTTLITAGVGMAMIFEGVQERLFRYRPTSEGIRIRCVMLLMYLFDLWSRIVPWFFLCSIIPLRQ